MDSYYPIDTIPEPKVPCCFFLSTAFIKLLKSLLRTFITLPCSSVTGAACCGVSTDSFILIPANACDLKDEYVIFIQNKDVPKNIDNSAIPSWIIDSDNLPDIKNIRNAWNVNNSGQIYFDRDKAIEIKKEQFRNLRKPLLEKLDVEFMRALENGDTSSIPIITQKKSDLRDITSVDFSSYDTPQKLHEFIPDLLKT